MIKLIAKGILLYATAILVVLFISGADSIMACGYSYFVKGLLLCVILIILCSKLLSQEEFAKLTSYKYFADE